MIGEAGLRVLADQREDSYILKFAGHIDLATVGKFEEALLQASTAPNPVVIVDLSEVDFIDSTGVSALMQAEAQARRDRDRIHFLAKFDPKVEAVLRMSGIYAELDLIQPEA